MGFNSTVVVMNDALHDIAEDPAFGGKLASAVHEVDNGKPVDVPALGHANAATVIETHHADGLIAVLVGGNTGWDLGYAGQWNVDPNTEDGKKTILRNLASRFGFDVSLRKRSVRKVGTGR